MAISRRASIGWRRHLFHRSKVPASAEGEGAYDRVVEVRRERIFASVRAPLLAGGFVKISFAAQA
jgi:hypothetical protein